MKISFAVSLHIIIRVYLRVQRLIFKLTAMLAIIPSSQRQQVTDELVNFNQASVESTENSSQVNIAQSSKTDLLDADNKIRKYPSTSRGANRRTGQAALTQKIFLI